MTLLLDRDADGRARLKSPALGVWKSLPLPGQVARSGQSFGILEVLGRSYNLQIPAGVQGIVMELPAIEARKPAAISYGQVLAVLGDALEGSVAALDSGKDTAIDSELVFRSSSSGRFYLRPAPDKAPFVAVGEVIETGHIIFLLEVMKTFSRVAYEGEGLPARAKVLRILPQDGDDLEAGQSVLELEAV